MLHDPTERGSLSSLADDEFDDLQDEESSYCSVCGAENVLTLGVCFTCGAPIYE